MSESNIEKARSMIENGQAWEVAVWAQRLVDAGAFDEQELRTFVKLFATEILSPTPRKTGGTGRFDADPVATMCRELDIAEFVKRRREEGVSLALACVDAELEFRKGDGTAKRLYNKWKHFV